MPVGARRHSREDVRAGATFPLLSGGCRAGVLIISTVDHRTEPPVAWPARRRARRREPGESLL